MTKLLLNLKSWILLPAFATLLVLSCRRDRVDSPIIEEELNLTGFTKIYAGERFNLIIIKGDEFFIKIKGPSNDVHDMEVTVTNNILDIQYAHFENDRPRIDVFITLPTLVSVNLAGAGTGTINGFQDQPNVIRAILSGASRLTMNGAGINVQIDITGASRLDVSGSTASLYGSISGGGRLNAYNLNSTEVDIDASGGSQAYVKVDHTLFATASGGSFIYYKGNPTIKNIDTSGGGQVIKE